MLVGFIGLVVQAFSLAQWQVALLIKLINSTAFIARHCRLSYFCRTAPSPCRYCVLRQDFSAYSSRPRALSFPVSQGEGFFCSE